MNKTPRRNIWALRDLPAEERDAIRLEVQDAARRGDHGAIAATVKEFVSLDIPMRDVGAMLLQEGEYNYGTQLEFELAEGLTAYVLADGADAVEDQVSKGVIKPTPRRVDCTPSVYEPDLLAGEVQPLLDLEAKATNAFVKQKTYFIWNLLRNAVSAGDDNYAVIADDALTAATLDAAIAAVQDAAGTAVAIVGRSTTVNDIAGFDGYDDTTLLEIRLTGALGVYRGGNILGLQQMMDEYGLRKKGTTNLITPYTVMVVGAGVGHYRSSAIFSDVQPLGLNLRRTYHYWRWDIGAILHPDFLYRIDLTA